MEGPAWVCPSQERRPVSGFSLVLLVWTDGRLRIPLGLRLWRRGGPSKSELALALLGYARNRLRCRPEYVLFDAWYPSRRLLKRIRDYGWCGVCRLKRHHRFNGQALRTHRRHPYWIECRLHPLASSRIIQAVIILYPGDANWAATNRNGVHA